MKLHADLRLGAATHTGTVRRANEDDYLILAPHDEAAVRGRGRLFAVADGMGGVAGGAEASRTAVRALAQSFVQGDGGAPMVERRMRQGFELACQRVFERSREHPALRGMGTTLTALNLVGAMATVGHVGDSRCYRLRDGELERLTTDHAVRGAENRLTRCVGGGRDREEMELKSIDVRPGDRFLLATDGLWGGLPHDEIVRVLERQPPQQAAEQLVRMALRGGGSDNATAVVVQVVALGETGALQEVAVPAGEVRDAPVLRGRSRARRGLRWPWVLIVLGLALTALTVARVLGFDPLSGR